MANLPAAFVHFGLGKCASTFMQNVWSVDARYTAVSLNQAAQTARQLARRGQTGTVPDLGFSFRPKAGTSLVAYSEGFTWAYLRKPEDQARLPDLQRLSARMIGRAGITDTALFMVRNPIDWIRSAHEQTIREGGDLDGHAFIRRHRKLVEHVLDLAYIKEVFSAEFDRVVFLSADELRTNPGRFWPLYAKTLNVPAPGEASIQRVSGDDKYSNRSLGPRLSLLARLNRHDRLLTEIWSGLSDAPDYVAKERDNVLPHYLNGGKWARRRVVEYASDNALQTLTTKIGIELEDNFTDIPIDDALRRHMETRFLDVLDTSADFADSTTLDIYRSAMRDNTRPATA